MKLSQMNHHQREATLKAREAVDFITGGYENSVMDGDMKQEEVPSREALMVEIYNSIDWRQDEIRFAGRDFIMERIQRRLEKYGY